MGRVTALLSVAAIVSMTAAVVAQAKPSFAGDWMMLGADGRGDPGTTLTIAQSATAMTLEYGGCGQAPASGKVTYTLDGSVSKNVVAGRGGGAPTEQIAKATWAGDKVVLTASTAAGEEKRTFSMTGDNLVIETSAPARSGGAPKVIKATYVRYKCGLGG
jgi:hypothetical protein